MKEQSWVDTFFTYIGMSILFSFYLFSKIYGEKNMDRLGKKLEQAAEKTEKKLKEEYEKEQSKS